MPDALTLDTLRPDRPFVRIDEERYELAHPRDVGLVGTAKTLRAIRLIESVSSESDDPTDVDKLHRALIESVDVVLLGYRDPVTCTVGDEGVCNARHRLGDYQMLQVIESFNAEASRSTAPQNRAGRRSKRSTGAKRSPVSAGSTRATARKSG